MVVLVSASHASLAGTGMGFLDRGGSCDWQLAISDPCHGVAGMGILGGGRRSIPIARDSEELGRGKLIERSSFSDVLQFLAFGIRSICH